MLIIRPVRNARKPCVVAFYEPRQEGIASIHVKDLRQPQGEAKQAA